jgi:acyl-CoA hydrolase
MTSPRLHSPGASRVLQTQLVLPPDTNALGTLFGGRLVEWIDLAAGVAAQRHSRLRVVTASIDDLHFLKPIRVGMIVELLAQVNATWRTSLECGCRVETENPRTGERVHACTAYLTFVAQDEAGQRIEIPQIVLEDDEDRRRAADADQRRRERLQRAQVKKARLAQHPAREITPAANAKAESK